MAKDFRTAIAESQQGAVAESHAYDSRYWGRQRAFSQVIADATRGMDAGMNRFTPQNPDLSSSRYAPDWRGHYLGQELPAHACDIKGGEITRKYSDDEPRDDHGRWSAAGEATADVDQHGTAYFHAKGSLTEKERTAMGVYVEDGYGPINRFLLTSADLPKAGAVHDQITALDSAMQKFTAAHDFAVYRLGRDWQVVSDKLKVGQQPVFKPFLSTTMRESLTGEFASDLGGAYDTHYKILVPKGAHFLPVDALDHDSGEREVILPRNSKFVIDKVDPRGHEVWMRMVP